VDMSQNELFREYKKNKRKIAENTEKIKSLRKEILGGSE